MEEAYGCTYLTVQQTRGRLDHICALEEVIGIGEGKSMNVIAFARLSRVAQSVKDMTVSLLIVLRKVAIDFAYGKTLPLHPLSVSLWTRPIMTRTKGTNRQFMRTLWARQY